MKPNIPWDAKIDYSKSMLKDMPQGFITVPEFITNGEMMMKTYPNAEICGEDDTFVSVKIDSTALPLPFLKKWWDKKYVLIKKQPGLKGAVAEKIIFDELITGMKEVEDEQTER